MPVLSKEEIFVSLTTVHAIGKRSTLSIIAGGRKAVTTDIQLPDAVIRYGLILTS